MDECLSRKILAFDEGQLEQEEIVPLFQELVNTRMIWSLPVGFLKAAGHLIRQGLIVAPRG